MTQILHIQKIIFGVKLSPPTKHNMMLFLQSNDNMELTSSLESERHAIRDIGQRLNDTSMELAETKQTVCFYSGYITT